MQKEERQNKILGLIRTKRIGTQEDLTELLETTGISVTQSSVSRDLDELGIIKVNGFYAIPEKTENPYFGPIGLDTAGENLIVAKCASGLASAIAVRIDAARISEIVGTIAGDDTIFIAVKDVKSQKTVMKRIWEIFKG